MWKCANCGKENRDDRNHCWSCSTVKGASTPIKTSSLASSVLEEPSSNQHADTGFSLTADEARSAQPESRRRLLNRYLDLYRAAGLLVGLGNTVKVAGISAGAGILLLFTFVGIVASSQSGLAFFPMLVVGAVFGALVGGIVFLLGILISAQGQILMAQADAAVHTSPFMTETEKLNAMSLTS